MEKSKQRYQNKLRKSKTSTTESTKAIRLALGPTTVLVRYAVFVSILCLQVYPEILIGREIRVW